MLVALQVLEDLERVGIVKVGIEEDEVRPRRRDPLESLPAADRPRDGIPILLQDELQPVSTPCIGIDDEYQPSI
jgi:hypothetical protein